MGKRNSSWYYNDVMIRFVLLLFCNFIFSCFIYGQSMVHVADSIRQQYHIPELAYAVVSSTNVYEMEVLGVKRIHTTIAAEHNDRFRIGSNTKGITGFIAALLVKQHHIEWDTKFFDLYPDLKTKANSAYHHLTLLNLLTFRSRLIPYTYTNEIPTESQFSGDGDTQRYKFTQWFFQQKPVKGKGSIHFSNLGYIAAALMLEKASGKTYQALVKDLGDELNISFYFGAPNTLDNLQPWGHDVSLTPEPPGDNYKLNWLQAAGNINVSLPGYIKFIQLQLRGLSGNSALLTKAEFNFLHYGLKRFAVGWFWLKDEKDQSCSYNIGNPGSFLTKVFIYKNADKAIIVFSNAQTTEADRGTDILIEALINKYGLNHIDKSVR
jgi:CubicO group peptidase (beta-lactamase class C family)